jgi:hypothetical protein
MNGNCAVAWKENASNVAERKWGLETQRINVIEY